MISSTRFLTLRDRGLAQFRRSLRQASQPPRSAGFTLTELLVAMVMGSIITGSLLFMIVNVLQFNQREDTRSETQREMKVALDYISTELREAVFVYDGNCMSATAPVGAGLCPGVLRHLPTALQSAGRTPVLAFWRVDELPQPLIQACATNAGQLYADPPPTAINGVPCLSRRSYTLVVYFLDTNKTGTWKGNARLRRYELPQFQPDGTRNVGWVDPTITNNNFAGWPLNSQGVNLQTQTTLPDGSPNLAQGVPVAPVEPEPVVLTDYVDTPTPPASPTNNPNNTVTCPQSPDDGNAPSVPTMLPRFERSPTAGSPSFYACVRGGGVDKQTPPVASNTGGRNQEVFLFLRGNTAGRSGTPTAARVTLDLETRVVTRGSYEKLPAP